MIKRGTEYNTVDLDMDPSVDRRSVAGTYNIIDGLPRYGIVSCGVLFSIECAVVYHRLNAFKLYWLFYVELLNLGQILFLWQYFLLSAIRMGELVSEAAVAWVDGVLTTLSTLSYPGMVNRLAQDTVLYI